MHDDLDPLQFAFDDDEAGPSHEEPDGITLSLLAWSLIFSGGVFAATLIPYLLSMTCDDMPLARAFRVFLLPTLTVSIALISLMPRWLTGCAPKRALGRRLLHAFFWAIATPYAFRLGLWISSLGEGVLGWSLSTLSLAAFLTFIAWWSFVNLLRASSDTNVRLILRRLRDSIDSCERDLRRSQRLDISSDRERAEHQKQSLFDPPGLFS